MEKTIKNIIIALFIMSIAICSFTIGQLYGSFSTAIVFSNYMNILEIEESITELQNNSLNNNYNNQDNRFDKMFEDYINAREEKQNADFNYALCYEGIYPHRKEFNQ